MCARFDIRLDDLRGPEVAALLAAHLDDVVRYSPIESVHALDLDELRAPDLAFYSVWDGAALVGCGALKELSAEHGELKSMRTAQAHLRRGVARALLAHLLAVARGRGYRRLSLETGAHAAFAPARALYGGFGFVRCGPFGAYGPDPHSVFMTLQLDE